MPLELKDISMIIGNCGPGEQIALTLAGPTTLSATPSSVTVAGVQKSVIRLGKHKGPGAPGQLPEKTLVDIIVFDDDCCIPQDNGTTWTFDRKIEAAVVGNVLILSLEPVAGTVA